MANGLRRALRGSRAGGGGLAPALAASAGGHLLVLAVGLLFSATAAPPQRRGVVEVFLPGRPVGEATLHTAQAAGRTRTPRPGAGKASKSAALVVASGVSAAFEGDLPLGAESAGVVPLPRGTPAVGAGEAGARPADPQAPPATTFQDKDVPPPPLPVHPAGEKRGGLPADGGEKPRATPFGGGDVGAAAGAFSVDFARAGGLRRQEEMTAGDGGPGGGFGKDASHLAAGLRGEGAGGRDSELLAALLREKIQSRIVYPEEAVRWGQEGEVLLRIRIDGGGYPAEIRVAKSSGVTLLDEAARRGVRSAAPLPRVHGWVEVPVRFFLR